MSITALKKKAAEFEQKKQFEKAIQVYILILNGLGSKVEEVDLALFNRVGDLLLRQGNVADALDYYERAVDRYAEGGFFNNAIALCNKILRHSPGRATVYYKLGKRSEERRVGKGVDLGGRRIIKKKKRTIEVDICVLHI